MESKTMKTVFTVVERGQGKSYWTRVGVGFVNRDGSTTLRLDAIPVNGTLQVRDWEPPFDRRSGVARPPARGGSARRAWRREGPAATLAAARRSTRAARRSFQETRSSERGGR